MEMVSNKTFVYVVDDDQNMRMSLSLFMKEFDYPVQSFANASAFYSVSSELTAGCVLLDLKMPGMDGLALQSALAEERSLHQIILLTAYGEIPDAVQAIRGGAIDFIAKPHRSEHLFEAISRAEENLCRVKERESVLELIDRLSPRERTVLDASVGGKASKQVAYELKLSTRTIEMHRSRIMKKFGVQNFSAALLLAATQDE